MIRKLILFPMAALALAALLTACGNDETAKQQSAQPSASSSGKAPFDRAFIDAMTPHHESAIEMARAAKAAGLDQPELVAIADDIISSQQAEIDQMARWREQWYGTSELDPNAAEVLGMSMAEMGMGSSADVFRDAEDVNAEFAAMMIDHHEGAIKMAELARSRAQHPEVRQLAERIIAAQKSEIRKMKPHAAMMDM